MQSDEVDIYFTSLPAIPEINVKNDLLGDLADGSFWDLGVRPLNKVVGVDIPFKIDNLGNAPLNLTGSPDRVSLSGAGASFFIVSQQPSKSHLLPGEMTIFKLRTKATTPPPVPPGWTKTVQFTVNIPNSDLGENPYDFTVKITVKD